MSRDLSKGLRAQKNTEENSKSKFGKLKNELPRQELKLTKTSPMIKLTATITQCEWDFLQKEVLERSQKKGKMQNLSHTLREILNEYQTFNKM